MNEATKFFNEGLACLNTNDISQAIEKFTAAIEHDENFADAYGARGMIYGGLSKVDEAILDLNRAIELNPNDARSYYNRGMIYAVRAKEFSKAVDDLNRAAELAPEHLPIYLQRGFAYLRMENYALALADFDRYIAGDQNFVPAYYWRSLCHKNLGNDAQAQADLAKAEALGYRG